MIHFFIGTKAQLIKTAPVMRELDRREYPFRLIDSGQHAEFTRAQREVLGTRIPDFQIVRENRDVTTMGAGMRWLLACAFQCGFRPGWIRQHVFNDQSGICVVHGDTASTLIGAWFARRIGMPIAHLESGLRSENLFDPFPEEWIRLRTMKLASILYAPDAEAVSNLERMSVRGRCVHTRGSTIIDALRYQSPHTAGTPVAAYALASCHRLETIRSRRRLSTIVDAINIVAKRIPVCFVVHRPTHNALVKTGLLDRLNSGVEMLPPQNHGEFVDLMRNAVCVLADGGSIQEECAALGVPILVLRNRTERPDGLNQNAMLMEFQIASVEMFLDSLPDLRQEPLPSDVSPSAIVAADLIEADQQILAGGANEPTGSVNASQKQSTNISVENPLNA